MIMAAADLLARNPNPTEAEVRKGLEGNLCRCTGYHNIVKAVLTPPRPATQRAAGRCRHERRRGARATGNGHVGRALRRKEDPRLITGRASYVDDINLTGQLWAAWVRSPEAHAKIVSIDTSAAKARDGVVAVYTDEDLDMEAGLPMAWVAARRRGQHARPLGPGQGRGQARRRPGRRSSSATTATPSSTPPRTSSSSTTRCRWSSTPRRRSRTARRSCTTQFGTNKVVRVVAGRRRPRGRLRRGRQIIERRIVNHRIAGAAIEPRAVLADYRADRLTVYSSTQVPHFLRLFLAIILGISEDRVRAIAPEVGGAFGSKLQIYAEEIGCAWASRKLGRPVKWVETRSEGMMVTHHGRDQIDKVKVGAKRDGTMTAFHAKIIADLGAYQMLLTPMIPPLSAFVMCGVYKTPAVQTDVIDVMTNKFPTDAIRGAGRPEATHLIEVDDGPDRGRAGDGPARGPAARTSSRRSPSRTRRRSASPTTPATTPRRSTSCSSTSTSPRFAARGGGAARPRASTAASGSAPTPRSAATRRRGSSARRLRPAGRRLGVRAGARPRQRRRRPSTRAPRRTARATRRASPRSWPTGSGIDPQQVDVIHGDTATGPVRPRHLRLAHAGRRRRGDGPGGREGGRQGQGDRRPPARGRPGRHRAARRQVDRPRLAGEGHGARRRRRRGLRPREPARRHGARARRDGVLRPGELRVPVRRARVRRRRRRRDRQGQGRPLRRGRRLRAGDQPDAHRRPGPRRHHARRSGRRSTSRSTTTRPASS